MSRTFNKDIFRKLTTVFPNILWRDVENAFRSIERIHQNIIGRHCGDFGDKLSQYLSICELIRANGLSSINGIEIGILFGGSCLNKLSAMRDLGVDGKIICIDPLNGFYGETVDIISGHPVTPQIFFENLRRLNFSSNQVELRRYFSSAPEAYIDLPYHSFEHLMIDGGHLYDDVKTDWSVFHPYVSPGGLVIIDDYNDHAWPDITRFASELLGSLPKDWQSAGYLGTTLILQHTAKQLTDLTRNSYLPFDSGEISPTGPALFDLYIGEARAAIWMKSFSQLETAVHGAFRVENISSNQQTEGLNCLVNLCKYLEFPLSEIERIISNLDSPHAILKTAEITDTPLVSYNSYLKLLHFPQFEFEANRKLGQFEYRHKNWHAAFRYLSAAIQLRPEVSDIYIFVTECAANLANWPTVIDYCRKGVLIDGISSSDKFRLYCRCGAALSHLSDCDAAEICFKSALAVPLISNNDFYHGSHLLGQCYAKAGKHQEAVKIALSALGHADLNRDQKADFLLQIANSQFAMKDFHQAQYYLEALLNEYPDRPDVIYKAKIHLAYCFFAQSNPNAARELFLELYSDEERTDTERLDAASGLITVLTQTRDFKRVHEFLNTIVTPITISDALRNDIILKIKEAMVRLKGEI